MVRRIDPLVERLRETVVAVSDILRSPSGSRWRHTGRELSEHAMVEHVVGGHRGGLVMRDAVERRVEGHSSFAVLLAKARYHFGRRSRGLRACGTANGR